jgi:hypothetical protein
VAADLTVVPPLFSRVGPNKPFTFNYPIDGVSTAFAVTHHANQLTVIISQTGAIGQVLHAESDATAGLASLESTTYTVKTLLGYAHFLRLTLRL